MKIGIFDSGLGGLLVFKEIIKKLPQYDYVYLGDNARVPYGNRSFEIIYKFTREAVEFLFEKNCQLIILACNTASSVALRKIQQEYLPKKYKDRRVLGIIVPTIEFLDLKNSRQTIGVIGTKATISSNAYKKEIKKINPKIRVIEKSTPLLVPFIEEGDINSKALEIILKDYLKIFVKNKIDKLVLACTHYGVIEKNIKKILGKNIKVLSQGKIVAEKLKIYLNNHPEIENRLLKNSKREVYLTDKPGKNYFFKKSFFVYKKVDLTLNK